MNALVRLIENREIIDVTKRHKWSSERTALEGAWYMYSAVINGVDWLVAAAGWKWSPWQRAKRITWGFSVEWKVRDCVESAGIHSKETVANLFSCDTDSGPVLLTRTYCRLLTHNSGWFLPKLIWHRLCHQYGLPIVIVLLLCNYSRRPVRR